MSLTLRVRRAVICIARQDNRIPDTKRSVGGFAPHHALHAAVTDVIQLLREPALIFRADSHFETTPPCRWQRRIT